MEDTYFDSQLTAEQIEAALKAINEVVSPINNGKLLAIQNGKIVAKSASEYADVPVLVSKTINTNGIYDPVNDDADGYSSVVVNVSGGSSDVYAFLHVIWLDTSVSVTATDGTTLLVSDTSGDYVFSIPNPGTWTVSDGTHTQAFNINTYGTSQEVHMEQVKSLVPTLTSMYGDNGEVIYNTSVNYYWNTRGDVWKAFDGNTTNYGQYQNENQSDFWIGYQFINLVYITDLEFYGNNYADSDDFLCLVEIMKNGMWVSVGTFHQLHRDPSVKTIQIGEFTDAVRVRSTTEKTSGHNLFIREIVINGSE